MAVILDKERLAQLIQEADDRWFAKHSGDYKYSEHLSHTADYIARNYNRKRKSNGKRPVARTPDGKRPGGRAGKETKDNQGVLGVPKPVRRRRAKV